MLYENYKRKIIRLSEIIKKIKRYRAWIIAGAAVIFALIAAMLSFKGVVFSVKDIPSAVTYGQTPDCGAKAFMARVSYEYADENGSEWHSTAPKRAGTYRVRAVSKRIFGAPNYGKEQTYQILPKKIDVIISQEFVPYGDDPAIYADLEFNDTINCSKFDYEDLSQAKMQASADKNSVIITDKDGTDVTASYAINVKQGEITIISRPLTVAAGDATAVYDGKALFCKEYQIIEGSLAYNDTITANFDSFQTNAGETENTAQIKITSGDGTDVTGRYDLKQIKGKLTVQKRPLSVVTYNAQGVYDGQPLASKNYTISADTPIPQGHDLILTNASQLTDVGTCENILTFKITDGQNEVTDNYILSVEKSALEVTQREITIKTFGASKIYDGQPVTENNYTIDSAQKLVENHVLQLSFTGSQTDAGQSQNTINNAAITESGRDVTHNYKIEFIWGDLIVTPRAVTVLTNTTEFIYNGKPQSDGGCKVVSQTQLAEGHSIKGTEITLTFVVNVTAKPVDNKFTAAITDAQSRDVTHNYIIKYEYGTLTVLPLKIEVSTRGTDLYYNGDWQSYGLFDTAPAIAAGQTARVKGEPPALKDVEPAGDSDYKIYSNEFEIEIFSGNDNVTSNYIIDYVSYGVLRMLPMLITVTTASKELIYNGQLQSDNSYKTNPALAAEHSIRIQGTAPSIKNVGEIENKFEIAIFDRANKNVNYCYTVKYVYGTIKILPRKATITTTDAEWEYNAEEHSNPNFTHSGFVEGHTFKILTDTITTITDVIRLENNAVVSIGNVFVVEVFDGDENVTYNYTLTYILGGLKITPRPITVKTNTRSWVYDGTVHYDDSFTVSKGSLLAGHAAFAYEIKGLADVKRLLDGGIGSIENNLLIHIFNKTDIKLVTSNYEISYDYGYLTILPRPIEVTTNSNEWIYDGLEHCDGGFEVTDGEIVEGQNSLVEGEIPVIINVIRLKDDSVGSKENKFAIEIYSEANKVTYNYDITYIYGGLTILPRPLTVRAGWGSVDYAGEAVCYDYAYIVSGSLVEGQFADAEFCYHTEIGTYDNIITGFWVYYGDEDVTYNYDITLIKGVLEIVPRHVYIFVYSAQKEYDGTPLTNPDYYDGSDYLLPGHFLTAKTVGSQTEPGESYNIIDPDSVKITDAKGNDVSHLYDVWIYWGYLHVWAREITIKTYSAEKDYDGTPLTRDGYEIIGELLDGHSEEVRVYGSRTAVGESGNWFSITIYDSNRNDVTDHYNIYSISGTLTVFGDAGGDINLDGTIDREGSGGSGGTPQVLFTATSAVKGTVYFRVKSFGDYLISGKWNNAAPYLSGGVNALYLMPVTLNQMGKNAAHITIEPKSYSLSYLLPYYALDGYGGSYDDTRINAFYNSAYSFNYIPYTYNHNDALSLNWSYQDFEAEYYKYVMQTYLQLPSTTRLKLLEIAAKNNLNADSPSIITDVAKFVQNLVKYDLKFEEYKGDIALYFFTQAKTAICQHYATAATAMLRALGIPARYTVGFAAEMSAGKTVEVTDKQAHAWVEVYIPGAGWVNIEVTGAGDGSGNTGGDGGGGSGEIGVVKQNLDIKPIDVYKKFDGTPLFAKNEIEGNDLASIILLKELLDNGYRYTATVSGSRTDPGVSSSRIEEFILYDSYGRNVTDSYEISYNPGRIHIINGEIIYIHLYSLQKYYDGRPLSYEPDDYWAGDVPEGFRLVFSLSGSLTDSGIMKLTDFEKLPFTVYDKANNDVTALYALVFDGEPLRIDRSVIEIASATVTKTYDGKPLKSDTTWISKGYFVPGHRYEAIVTGTITDIGFEFNTISAVTVYDETGRDVTKNYCIIGAFGVLTVRE